jgi:hypothetical protein
MNDLVLLDNLGEALAILGVAGVVSLFFFPEGRRLAERSLAVLFTLMAIGGTALMWRADRLVEAKRDLTPAEQAELSKAISQFPNAKFEVLTSRDDREAHSLALKIVDAIKGGSGGTPLFEEEEHLLPVGLTLIFDPEDVDLRRNIANTVGRLFIEARIAVISDETAGLGEQRVRIVVGGKP